MKRYLVGCLVVWVILVGCGSTSPENQAEGAVKAGSPQKTARNEKPPISAVDEIRNGTSPTNKQDDIRIGEPPEGSPRELAPVEDGKYIASQPNGLPLFNQFFEFTPNTKKVGLLSGYDLPGGMNMQGNYGNTSITSSRLKRHKRLLLGPILVSTERSKVGYGLGCADVGISFEDYAKVRISANYVVSPVEAGQTKQDQASGYSAVVFFDPRVGREGKKLISGTLSVTRNGSRAAQFMLGPSSPIPADIDDTPLASTGFPIIEVWNINRKADVVQWSVEEEGTTTHKGVFGFPVVGTAPKLVYYRVRISEQGSR